MKVGVGRKTWKTVSERPQSYDTTSGFSFLPGGNWFGLMPTGLRDIPAGLAIPYVENRFPAFCNLLYSFFSFKVKHTTADFDFSSSKFLLADLCDVVK